MTAFKIKNGANVGYTTAEIATLVSGYTLSDAGALLYDTDLNTTQVWNGTALESISGGSSSSFISQDITIAANADDLIDFSAFDLTQPIMVVFNITTIIQPQPWNLYMTFEADTLTIQTQNDLTIPTNAGFPAQHTFTCDMSSLIGDGDIYILTSGTFAGGYDKVMLYQYTGGSVVPTTNEINLTGIEDQFFLISEADFVSAGIISDQWFDISFLFTIHAAYVGGGVVIIGSYSGLNIINQMLPQLFGQIGSNTDIYAINLRMKIDLLTDLIIAPEAGISVDFLTISQ